ncbi:MAG: leucine-rich repeat protein, partial [Clostridia bacterium]|nr:leucine-rich repeat protein [Clostridia bacterium]
IGEYAFNSTEANMIRWGSGLETIGDDAFRYTSIGAELHLPESLRVIGMEAFKGATLRNVYIGGNITSIGANAFNRTNLNYLAIDAYHVIDVGEDAFAGTWLEDVDLPWDSDQENQQAWQALIDSQVEGCKVWINNPEDCDLPETGACSYDYYADGTMYVTGYEGERENLVLYHTMDGVQVTGIGDGAFKGNQTVKKYRVTHNDTFTTIGAEAFAESAVEVVDLYYTTETIGAGAFRDCLGLTEITLPASLKSVGEGAFSGCVNLAKVNILCDPAIIPADAFAGTAYAAAPIVEMPFEATAEADFEFDAETGTIVGYIGDDVDVVIPRAIGDTTVRAIGYNAFERARDYTDTDIATNQTSWLPLRSVVIPETVEEIADSAFSYCQQLELVICYAPLSSTGRETFLVCRSLRDVLFVNGVSEIDNYCFESCDMLQHVYWGDHLRRIGVNAFNRVGLMSLVIDAEIVDEGAFNHSDLWDVTLTDRVREIHSAAFYACENLNYITCLFSDADRFVDGAPFGGVPQTGVTTTFPAATTEEQLKDLNAKLNVWNGGHLGSGNEITLEDPYIFVDEMPDPEEIYARVTSQSVPSVISLEPERPLVLPDPIGVIDDALGVWKLSVMAEDGEEYDVSLFGIDMTLSLSGDHSVSLISEDEQQGEWYLQDGVLYIGIDGDSVPAGLDRAGRLYLVQDGAEMYFLRESAADAPEPVTDGGDEDSFVPVRAEQYMPMLGEWHGIWVATAVEQLNPQTAWDYDMILNVYEDGTARLDEDALQNLQSYNGYVMLGWQPLTLLEDGRYLQLGDTLSGSMYYARDPGEELPDKYKNALQEAQEAIRATEVPQPTVSPAAVTQAAPGSYQLDVKYLAISYSAGGVTVDASVLPEYAITLHDGG